MPRLAAEDTEQIPCGRCFDRIGKKIHRSERCSPQTGSGPRCGNCVTVHRHCFKIPEAAHAAVLRMLDMRKQLWLGRITEDDFMYWHSVARQVIDDAKAAPDEEQATASPETQSPAVQQGSSAQLATPRQRDSAAGIIAARGKSAQNHVARDNAPQQNVLEPDEEGMEIDKMGVAATLHAILRTLIKIDRRMESLEAQI